MLTSFHRPPLVRYCTLGKRGFGTRTASVDDSDPASGAASLALITCGSAKRAASADGDSKGDGGSMWLPRSGDARATPRVS
jgi:hypothetical protein